MPVSLVLTQCKCIIILSKPSRTVYTIHTCYIYPEYMSKVNAHYERIDPRNEARNFVPEVDSILICNVQCIVKTEDAFRTDRPPKRSFPLRFGGRSVHNAHFLCSFIRGNTKLISEFFFTTFLHSSVFAPCRERVGSATYRRDRVL